MDYIRNYLITFAGNFAFSYYIFEEGTFNKPLMFATFMLLLIMTIDYMKNRNKYTLD
ncbi:hypothetical protein [Paenibacillus sp. BGI2013]|uniref:hypothetical protein n=1 Tax=Paenibacillus sp. BGI2013 TaxID=2058902 RepID=UPI0015D5B4FC|nr:hypothetical protein [Paenibacillus sp. BGI2013]